MPTDYAKALENALRDETTKAAPVRPPAPGPDRAGLSFTASAVRADGKTFSATAVTAMTIEERMQKLIGSMADVSGIAAVNAVSVAGRLPLAAPVSATAGSFELSEGTVFERYAQALDEIDRIVDNMRRDLARAREVLGG